LSAARTYRDLWRQRACDLLSRWVSEVQPVISTRIDVSPDVLAIVGVGVEGHDILYSAEITVSDMIAAGALA